MHKKNKNTLTVVATIKNLIVAILFVIVIFGTIFAIFGSRISTAI